MSVHPTFTTYLNKLIALQNQTVKIVGGGKYRENATSYYSKLNVLKLPDLYKFEIAKMVYSFMHNNLPSSYAYYFIKTCNVSNLNTRSTSNNTLWTLRYRTNRLQRSINFQGVKICNSMSFEIQRFPKQAFKRKLK